MTRSVVAIDAVRGRRGLSVRVVLGVVAGFGGVAFLMRPGAVGGGASAPLAICRWLSNLPPRAS